MVHYIRLGLLTLVLGVPFFAQALPKDEPTHLFEACRLLVGDEHGRFVSAPFQLTKQSALATIYEASAGGITVQIAHNNGRVAVIGEEDLSWRSQMAHELELQLLRNQESQNAFEASKSKNIEQYERWLKQTPDDRQVQNLLDAERKETYRPPVPRKSAPPRYPVFYQFTKIEKGSLGASGCAIGTQTDSAAYQNFLSLGIDSEQKIFEYLVDGKTGFFHSASPAEPGQQFSKNCHGDRILVSCSPQL